MEMRPKALVVEDDPITQRVLSAILESEGAEVDLASDGNEALQLIAQNEYAIILLDIVLPTMSGTAVMDQLLQTTPEVLERIIVVTGVDVTEIRKLFPRVRDAWGKPVLPARLRAAIRSSVPTPDAGASVA